MQTVQDILNRNSQPLLSLNPDHSVLDAIQMLSYYDVGALMVFEGKKLVGIFSERDYTRKIVMLKRDSANTKVKDIMSTDVACISADKSVEDCLKMMNSG